MHPLYVYALKVIVCSTVLYAYYWFLLRNKVFHQYNRFYLLATAALSITLPLLKIEWLYQPQQATGVVHLLHAINGEGNMLDEVIVTNNRGIDWVSLSIQVYLVTAAGLVLWLLRGLAIIYMIYRRGFIMSKEPVTLVSSSAKGTPFSFFKLIFWNNQIDIDSHAGRQIFQHEVAHVQQKHSWDKMFINVLLSVCWYNPVFWLIRKELNMIHEFMADKKAVEDNNTAAFAAMILQATYPQHRFNLTNNFFYSPIKRRLMMIKKYNMVKSGYLSRLLVLPMAAIIFTLVTIKAKSTGYGFAPNVHRTVTVVIDAGHGGKDFGAMANEIYEKDLCLQIAQKVLALNENPNLKIILTRSTDIYQTPPEKANLINSLQADLAISIHIGATGNKAETKESGVHVWINKDELPNLPESRILANALLQSFASNFALQVKPNPMQREKGIWILKSTQCPIALLEPGFINNAKDLTIISSREGQENIARNILMGIEKYLATDKSKLLQQPIAMIKKDTLPEGKIVPEQIEPTATIEKVADKIDNEKALVIINNKVIGTMEELKTKYEIEQLELSTKKLSMTMLAPQAAVKKYGERASFGAVELTMPDDIKIKMEVHTPSSNTNGLPMIGVTPLYILDGAETTPAALNINPETIKEITVLKGENATKWYGEKGKNGVVEIITKQAPASIIRQANERKKVLTPNDKNSQENNGALDEVVVVSSSESLTAGSHPSEAIFTQAEQMPQFPGGTEAWKKYLMSNLDNNLPVKEGWAPGIYKIMVSFVVRKDGSITHVKADNYPASKTAAHCVALIANGPKWKPAIQNGNTVNCISKQPITFVIDKGGYK
jgi:N-acetylmuramoyl-L-alanine amidase